MMDLLKDSQKRVFARAWRELARVVGQGRKHFFLKKEAKTFAHWLDA
jgi:hypothetical protein